MISTLTPAGWTRSLTEATSNAAAERVQLTVVVPTRNEPDTVDELVERIRRTLGPTGFRYEVLFIDDSDDATTKTIAAHACQGSVVRLLHRPPSARTGGRGGARHTGLSEARGTHALCIDADLRHPPELLAPMARVLLAGRADVVLGTRYLAGGDNAGGGGPWRRCASVIARDIARAAVPGLRGSTDPGSDFFGFDVRLLDGVVLRPLAATTLIDVLARSSWTSIAEVPYRVGSSGPGRSSVSTSDSLRFVRHLARLRCDPTVRLLRRRTAAVGQAFGVPADVSETSDGLLTMVMRHSS